MEEFNGKRPPHAGFIDPEAAKAHVRARRASRVAQCSDHFADVLDGEAETGVLASGCGVLAHEAIEHEISASAIADPVGVADKEGEGHA